MRAESGEGAEPFEEGVLWLDVVCVEELTALEEFEEVVLEEVLEEELFVEPE